MGNSLRKTGATPNVPLTNFKRTKIIATVGPVTDSYEAILGLIKAGANGIRINFSYGSQPEYSRQIKWIRKAALECGKPVAIIQDLQGPKMRLGDFDGIVSIEKGQTYSFAFEADYANTGHIPTQYDLSQKVKRGERMFLYDGKIRMTINSVRNSIVRAEAENNGILIRRRGVDLPDTDFGGDIITAKDKADLVYGSAHDIDYVALSFVQGVADVRHLRTLLRNMNCNAKIIAKIETKAAVDDVENIVKESDVVMIARGDLGVETALESVPIVQRQIIGLGQRYATPTIVATQMLDSMTDTPEPTRAEVSDIATAVIVGADCVMLSNETASGSYPIEAVQIMKRVILYTENHIPLKVSFPDNQDSSRQSAISSAIINLAANVEAKAVVAETKSGATALNIAGRRSSVPIIAVTNDSRVSQQLAIVYGVKSYVRPVDPMAATKLSDWLQRNKVLNKGDILVTASGRHPGVVGTTDTIKVRVLE